MAEWRNSSTTTAESYLRNAAGGVVTGGNINVDGVQYSLSNAHFAPGSGDTVNRLFGATFDSQRRPDWRIEAG